MDKRNKHDLEHLPENVRRILLTVRETLVTEDYSALLNFLTRQANIAQSTSTRAKAADGAEAQVRNLDRELVVARRRIAELESKGE